MRIRILGNSVAKSSIQRMASRFSRNGSMSRTSGRCCRTSLFASSKVCAAPQTWYRGSLPIIATNPRSLMMVSPTATTRNGCVPVGVTALFFTDASLKIGRGWCKHLLALRVKSQYRQSRSQCELTFEVSCFIFPILICPPATLGGESWGFLGESCLAFRDFSSLTTRFQPPIVCVYYTQIWRMSSHKFRTT